MKNWEHQETDGIEEQWQTVKTLINDTAQRIVDKPQRKHQDWFDEGDEELKTLLDNQNCGRAKQLQNNTRSNKAKYVEARRKLQQYTRKLKSFWWKAKAEELQHAANINDMKAFYTGLRAVYGPTKRGTT